jgi:ABC-2 type transport system ATP-binding protein
VIIDHGKVIESGTLPELVDRTVGRHRLVTLRLVAPIPSPAGDGGSLDVDPEDARVLRARMTDVAGELPPLLERIRAAGGAVDDVEVRGPSLQAVFIHLTGRELRE